MRSNACIAGAVVLASFLTVTARAELVTVAFRGTIYQVDSPLVGGPFSIGQTIEGQYTYENDPALNPDINPGTVGQYAIASSSDVSVDGQTYATSPGVGLTIFNDVDGWDAGVAISVPPIGSYTGNSFSVTLRDLDSTVFADDSLPAGPPALTEFEMARLLLIYSGPGGAALIEADVTLHEIVTDPVTLEFSGLLFDKEDLGGATYSGVDIDDPMQGALTIGRTAAGSMQDPFGRHLFPGAEFFGTLLGDGIETSTEGSIRPLEVGFDDNAVSDQETIDLINAILGTNLPAGTQFDLAEIETDITIGNRRIEFGVSFISMDLNLIVGDGYRPFPTLDEVDVALYFVIEEIDDVEVYNALGLIDSFGPRTTPGEATDLLVTGFDRATGTIDVSYAAACGAADHVLRFGSLSQVSAQIYDGAVCSIGTSGTQSFDPGAGDAFFLIVAHDGGTEGSYGVDSAGAERPADALDPVCNLTQELTDRCDF